MNDFRHRISASAEFDDARYWTFTRDTRLPHGTFGKRRDWDAVVLVACCVLLALGLLVVNIAP